MDIFEFYKELNKLEEEKKNNINNSLSLPIGVITGLVGVLFYFLTFFDFKLSLVTSIIFLIIILASIIFLLLSIYHLIKSYSNFHEGYDYVYLADAMELNLYHKELKNYYQVNPNLIDNSDAEFKQYILDELVRNTDSNQKNNKQKSKHRFNCEKHLISSFFLLCLCLFSFGYNFSLKKDKKENCYLDISSKENRNFIDSIILNHKIMANETNQPPRRPIPPPSQVIKEGQNPKPQIPPPPRKSGK